MKWISLTFIKWLNHSYWPLRPEGDITTDGPANKQSKPEKSVRMSLTMKWWCFFIHSKTSLGWTNVTYCSITSNTWGVGQHFCQNSPVSYSALNSKVIPLSVLCSFSTGKQTCADMYFEATGQSWFVQSPLTRANSLSRLAGVNEINVKYCLLTWTGIFHGCRKNCLQKLTWQQVI